jgi:thymidylate synthase ThyX
MVIEVKIIEDSISPTRARLTTFQLRYPRFIHAEFMTHRLFSRNASSSRAIPAKKMFKEIEDNPAMPIHWGMNQKGMQAHEEMDDFQARVCQELWVDARDSVMRVAEALDGMGLHKQVVNRMLEPWSHISVVVTASEFDNFFKLRCHRDAQPEIKKLADMMYAAYSNSVPRRLNVGQWHLPYIKDEERFAPGSYSVKGGLKNEGSLIKASCARCARVSYLTHDNEEPSIDVDVALHDRLLTSRHLSPFEHVATPNADPNTWSGNFKGWVQYRKTLKGECCNNYEPDISDEHEQE